MTVFGVGINDADYKTVGGRGRNQWCCPYFSRWKNMLKRCYYPKYKVKYPTYEGCTVCDEWLYFSKFKAWMETQEWEGKELDKDLLRVGNKCYSPDTCTFVTPVINSLIISQKYSKAGFLMGVTYHPSTGKYRAVCRNSITGKQESLGLFHKEVDAHMAWKRRKRELLIEVASSLEDGTIKQALLQHYKHEENL